MATTSINKTVAKTAVKNLESDYSNLITHLDSYVEHIQAMNANAWSGGSRANKTYKVAQSYYSNSVDVVNALNVIITSLDSYVAALDLLV